MVITPFSYSYSEHEPSSLPNLPFEQIYSPIQFIIEEHGIDRILEIDRSLERRESLVNLVELRDDSLLSLAHCQGEGSSRGNHDDGPLCPERTSYQFAP